MTNQEIFRVDLLNQPKKAQELTWEILGDQKLNDHIDEWMLSYASKVPSKKCLPLMLQGLSSFTRKVLTKLQTIPFGETVSYQELAVMLGSPRGARAVGSACGRNPFLLIVPCHRVLASDGSLGGFSAGLHLKPMLLAFEEVD